MKSEPPPLPRQPPPIVIIKESPKRGGILRILGLCLIVLVAFPVIIGVVGLAIAIVSQKLLKTAPSGNAMKSSIVVRSTATTVAPVAHPRPNAPAKVKASSDSETWKTLLNGPSLLHELTARRESDGSIVIAGKLALPPETKIWIQLLQATALGKTQVVAQCEALVDSNCGFQSQGFTERGQPLPDGDHLVEVFAHFNGLWQAKQNLSRVGEGGALLPIASLVPNDEEFPNAARHLEEVRVLMFPDIPEEARGIAAVKRWQAKGAKFTVEGWISEVEGTYSSMHGKDQKAFRRIAWSARKVRDDEWIVALDCYDEGTLKKAEWTWNPKTDSIHYADPLAKSLSGLFSGALQLKTR